MRARVNRKKTKKAEENEIRENTRKGIENESGCKTLTVMSGSSAVIALSVKARRAVIGRSGSGSPPPAPPALEAINAGGRGALMGGLIALAGQTLRALSRRNRHRQRVRP